MKELTEQSTVLEGKMERGTEAALSLVLHDAKESIVTGWELAFSWSGE